MPVNRGYEVQIDDRGDDYHNTGALYSLTEVKARPAKPGEWNTMEITLDGERTIVTVNGELVTDYKEGDPVPEKKIWYEPDRGPRPVRGYIGLQNHGEEDVVYFKEVSVRALAPSQSYSSSWESAPESCRETNTRPAPSKRVRSAPGAGGFGTPARTPNRRCCCSPCAGS